ncbi:MAG: hypothetical protein DWP98_02125 [Bacteroidetes bacterium]|nr:MAG: hypothetical protein DWP98_02125 [Bacteroidota bacterium]MBL1145542.1 hypothetical protein [Bacteroidota bacterium]NOG58339.1 hypothetical protein [Bacteroidota bacterium]
MKNLFKTTAMLMALTIGMVSCEKEEINNPSNINNQKDVTSKKKTVIQKSGDDDEIYNDILDFADAIGSENVSEQEAEYGLELLEATLNLNLTNDDYLPQEVHFVETEYQVEVSTNGGLVITGEEVESIYSELYDDIYDEASNFTFDTENDGKFISVIDLDWSTLEEGTNTIFVSYAIHSFYNIHPSCAFTESWKPMFNLGGCNSNLATSSDAAQEIQRRANKLTCNSNLTNCGNSVWFSMSKTPFIYPWSNQGWSQKYTNTSIWDDVTYASVCLGPTRLDELVDSCIWIGNNEKPSNSAISLKNIIVSTDILTSTQNTVYTHRYRYFYGKCVGSAISKPKPCFSC